MIPNTPLSLNRIVRSIEDVHKALAMMNARMADRSLDDGDGLVGEIWEGQDGDYEPILAVMPWRLYAALRHGLSSDPVAVDPRDERLSRELDDDQIAMLRAFIKLELGFGDFDPIPAPDAKLQRVRLRKRPVE